MSAYPIYFIEQTLNFLLYPSSFRQTSQNLDQGFLTWTLVPTPCPFASLPLFSVIFLSVVYLWNSLASLVVLAPIIIIGSCLNYAFFLDLTIHVLIFLFELPCQFHMIILAMSYIVFIVFVLCNSVLFVNVYYIVLWLFIMILTSLMYFVNVCKRRSQMGPTGQWEPAGSPYFHEQAQGPQKLRHWQQITCIYTVLSDTTSLILIPIPSTFMLVLANTNTNTSTLLEINNLGLQFWLRNSNILS